MATEKEPSQRPAIPLVGVLLCVAVYALVSWRMDGAPKREPRREESAAVLEEAPPDFWATDGADAGVWVPARPLPIKPFEGQKTPPCTKRVQVELNGGCWIETSVQPPCEELFEHQRKCYVPVRMAQPPPTSVGP